MGYTQVKILDHLHDQMKELAGPERGDIAKEYTEALEEHIKKKKLDILVKETGIEQYINSRITRAEEHIASMIARDTINGSMSLMGIITLLEKLLKVDRESLQNELRKQGARYFSASMNEDKKKKQEMKKSKIEEEKK